MHSNDETAASPNYRQRTAEGGEAVPFLIMLAIMGTWAYFVLRDRPLSDYLCLFFAAIILTAVAEPLGSLVFHRYVWRLGIIRAFLPDRAVGSLVIGFFLDPLLGVVFAHYSERWAVPKAAAVSLLLAVFEAWLVRHGYVIYSGWHPLYSALAFFGYFMIMWQLARRDPPMPRWLHVYGFSLFLLYFLDVSMQGAVGLWHLSVPRWNWERMLSLLLHAWAPAPLATLIAVTPLARRWWLWGAVAVSGLAAVDLLLVALGWMEVGWVGLTVILAGNGVTIWLAVRYSAWLRRHEPADAPPRWEPPIHLR
jgi:hypothetical protein